MSMSEEEKKKAESEDKKGAKKVETLVDVKASLIQLDAKMMKGYNAKDVRVREALAAKVAVMSKKKKEA